jgi:hypothetical protein
MAFERHELTVYEPHWAKGFLENVAQPYSCLIRAGDVRGNAKTERQRCLAGPP